MIVAKMLDTEEFGIYNYLVAFTFLFTLLADFGISRAITKYTAEYNVSDKEKVELIFFNSGLILFALIIVFSTILFLFREAIVGEYHYYLIHLIPIFIFLPFTSLYDGIYNGLKEFKKISIIYVFTGIITLSAAYFLIQQYKILGAFYSLDLYYILLFLFLTIDYKKFHFKFDKVLFKSISRYSLILGVSSLGFFMYAKANVIILGKFDFFNEAGYYELIDKIFTLFTFAFIIFGQVISPRITELMVEKKVKVILSYFNKIIIIISVFSIFSAIILYFIFPFIMQLFLEKYLNDEFIQMFNLLLLHMPFVLISSCIAQPFIIGTGLAKYSLLTIPFGLLNIGLSILFVSKYGFIGAVYGILIVSITNKALTYYLIHRNLKLKS